jgi:Lrp/AsnC family transcriptional regulator, regulator for asnA, asnC and gidA
MSHKVDAIDRAIVDLLIQDGRISSTAIARKIGGISERAVRYRLDRMIREGIIRVSAIANPKALGLPVIADVFVEVEPGRILEVAHKIAKLEQVSYVACSTGDRDLSVQIVARDNETLYDLVTRTIGKVPGVRKTTTLLLPLILKDVYQWHIPASVCEDNPK